MPRPKSDHKPIAFHLSPEHLTALDLIAVVAGDIHADGPKRGEPNRSATLRRLIEQAANVARKKMEKIPG